MEGEWITLEVEDGSRMRAWTERGRAGPGDAPFRGMLLLQAAFGVNAHLREVAGRFAALGYTVVAPELFHRDAPEFDGSMDRLQEAMDQIQALTVDGQSADLRAAHAWLVGPGGIAPEHVGAIGFCMGGRAAFLANAVLPLAASIAYYGGGIAPALLDRAGALSGPQLLVWAGQDARILPEHVRAVEDALRAAEKRYASVVFSHAQHSFFDESLPRYDREAAHQSWALALAFLDDHIGGR